jgi:hypothetical protein
MRAGLIEGDGAGRGRRGPGHGHLGGLAAAEFQDQGGGEFEAGHGELRVHPAGEAVLGVGGDAGDPPRLRRADRVEISAFQEDLGGGLAAARGGPAHDAPQANRPRAVGDDAHLRGDRIGLAVQGLQALPLAAHPRLNEAPR